MGKFADKYFRVEPWRIVEEGFNPDYAQVAESIFSLGNEYMGLRGYFEEGYSGEGLQGSYVNGIYEERPVQKSGYKGMLSHTDFMVNTVDWAYLRIICNDITLDISRIEPQDFYRSLDLHTGLLCRSFCWQLDENTKIKLCFERFLSMTNPNLAGSRLEISVLEGKADFKITAGLDFSPIHRSTGKNHWDCTNQRATANSCEIMGTTKTTGQRLYAAAKFYGLEGSELIGDKFAGVEFSEHRKAGEELSLTRVVELHACKKQSDAKEFETQLKAVPDKLSAANYEIELKASTDWWKKQWELSDIVIEGDDDNQQGIRYCLFQMHQTLHTAGHSAVIGAKGLTGEAYNGNSFWDTEVHCLPFYIFNNPEAAKNILMFRYDTLPQARERARALDCDGAFYPIATISGEECCDLWQHANLQLQASTGVAYGLWNYCRLTGDTDFLYQYGAELLVEISRMLASRGAYGGRDGKYGYYCVMGPDEFQMMVNNNAYTNFMAIKSLQYSLETLAAMKTDEPEKYRELASKLNIMEAELKDWEKKAEDMYLPYDGASLLFEQHDGFFALPHVDIKSIPTEEFPLYSHWAYDRIYRNDMIKQPDVLMFMMMYPSDFSDEEIASNFDYYEPRCIHESSLSPSVHSILACRLGRQSQAYDFFSFATRMDLDNYNRNSHEGLHTTSIACSWLNIVYGFGGLRSDGEVLELAPYIPEQWQGYKFSLQHEGCIISVEVDKDQASISSSGEKNIELRIYGQTVLLGSEKISIKQVKQIS